jgi:Glycosyl hydrolases family 32 N-terminal domain
MNTTRRQFAASTLAASIAAAAPRVLHAATDPIAPYRTPYKYSELILKASGRKGDFDERAVDDPIIFRANGRFYMLYIGFDGIGYQTGLAESTDLLHWSRTALVGPRDSNSQYTKYNLAISSILRDKNLHGTGEALKVNGQYLAAWNAYPGAGYEEGAAVIGLATSPDLLHWTLTDPILTPQDGAPWERGGLYRPDLFLDKGTYYLYYNAKTDSLPKAEGGGWHEQTGVASSSDLKHWTRYAGNPILPNGPRGTDTWSAANPLHNQTPSIPDARDSRFASNPFVVKNGAQYAIFYFGFGYQRPGRACEMLALGHDPYHFTKVTDILIDTGAPGSIDETFAHKPSVIFHEGTLYHFYCAVSGKYPDEVRGIAVARSQSWLAK